MVKIVVGYALEAKKVESFLKQSLVTHASERGIHFHALDPNTPLDEQYQQAQFQCLIHKLYDLAWQHNLVHFKSSHPHVAIVDSPTAVLRLQDRVSMLDGITRIPPLAPGVASFGVPRQVMLLDDKTLQLENLTFPVVAKPLQADGHELSLVFKPQGLAKVTPPAVLQEFVNHGGVVFKVYVAGDHVRCVSRSSLPDLNLGSIQAGQDIMPFSRISNRAAADAAGEPADVPEAPPADLVNHLAAGLREELQLRLFNFDMILDTRQSKKTYLIIDINYFPGYAKLPGYETILTDFILDVVNTNTLIQDHQQLENQAGPQTGHRCDL